MCAVSMISDHYRDKWNTLPYIQPIAEQALTVKWITLDEWNDYQALKAKAKEYDARTNQTDCAKPDIEEWEERVLAVLAKHGIFPTK